MQYRVNRSAYISINSTLEVNTTRNVVTVEETLENKVIIKLMSVMKNSKISTKVSNERNARVFLHPTTLWKKANMNINNNCSINPIPITLGISVIKE